MCGEHLEPFGRHHMHRGSSPHVRGALRTRTFVRVVRGIIPACAGSTARFSTVNGLTGDHPRMCGEHNGYRFDAEKPRGSSPHVRGAPVCSTCTPRNTGIIPACAGSTRNPPTRPPLRWDHPRMCGEHETLCSFLQRIRGSSPHVRGAHCNYCNVLRFAGIIPACAGSTPARYPAWQRLRDHPRMCGEHTPMAAAHTCLEGSSPHVRGALQASRRSGARPGIIPACAGSTKAQRCGDAEGRDHPRMCGEHDLSRRTVALPRGSSPHVRGARPWRDCRAVRAGIIPACAGSTYANTDGCILSGDHPRMCGEHRI